MTKKEVIKKMYRHLFIKGYVNNQKDLAKKIGSSETTISLALKGDEKYLTNKLLYRINDSFNSPFNREWVATGEGEMLIQKSKSDNFVTINNDSATISGNHVIGGSINNGDTLAYKQEIEMLKTQIEMLNKDKENLQRIIDKLLEK